MTYTLGTEMTREQQLQHERDSWEMASKHNAALASTAYTLLAEAVARVEIANREGNPILSAWLVDARKAVARWER